MLIKRPTPEPVSPLPAPPDAEATFSRRRREKERVAGMVQSDASPATHASVILCQMTSALAEAPDFRVTVAPDAGNGLREPSQIMADKLVTVRRARVGATVGHLATADLRRLDVAMGLAD